MTENPQIDSPEHRARVQDELHAARTFEATRRNLKEMLAENLAAEAKRNAEVPPKRAGAAWSVAERLTRRFGLGSDPERRQRFYGKLERLVEEHGDQVLTIISDCVWAAEKARSKQRYFCKAVSLRLKENGFGLEGPNNDW